MELPRDTASGRRRGLVLGSGGLLGAAWTVGALTALEESTGVDMRAVDYLAGTSAGSVTAAMLGAGVSVEQLRLHQLGQGTDGPLAEMTWDYDHATGGSRPRRPRLTAGSPGMVARNVRRLRKMPPTAVLAAFLPEGRTDLSSIGELVRSVTPGGGWSPHPGVWIVTMDYDSGRRVPFGRAGAPEAELADAVMASCSIPGWFTPVVIDGRRYIDGAACSATSADLLAGLELDEVYIVAPSVSFETDRPRALLPRVERAWRTRVTRRCVREAAKLRAEGTEVTILGPGPDDLAQIGGNVMDAKRRLKVLETSVRTSAAALTSGSTAA
ncbi:patatin-like phospholipase family protein [Phytoactinopolyspora alkaliphila]|uniref:Patatin-like phospholipase family protein n=1 Tax=Phytoactinopolyspora alkaliphila TaxID=1783498 RepID=A0A6N9YQV4_9ACTN|nr:patatin-like phospholipase family protein [Phytoactinopolyspora alkaliphila]NED97315.1 patatin-like phospholipase family protein [Phytoactinopolyspora alkaliphila]